MVVLLPSAGSSPCSCVHYHESSSALNVLLLLLASRTLFAVHCSAHLGLGARVLPSKAVGANPAITILSTNTKLKSMRVPETILQMLVVMCMARRTHCGGSA